MLVFVSDFTSELFCGGFQMSNNCKKPVSRSDVIYYNACNLSYST